jgi:cytochrome c oxidase subunit II
MWKDVSGWEISVSPAAFGFVSPRRRVALMVMVVVSVVMAVGVVVLFSHPALAACAPKNSTQPVGSCPSAPALGPALAHSQQDTDILHLFLIILAESAVVFALVLIALFICIAKFSHRPGHDEEPRQVYGNRRIEIAWTTIPAVILFVAFVATVVVQNQVNSPAHAAGALKVEAIGHQWWWEFRIPTYHVVTANEIHIPANTLVEIDTTSVDVIHSFWVPELDRQIDATPNNNTIVYIDTADKGTYAGACYEFCGQGHAWMQFRMTVDTPAKFRRWARHEASPPALPTSALAARGESIFFGQSCGACHTIDGTPANGVAAPNLSHVGSRHIIAGGVLVMSELNLERWIHDPNHWKEGVLMPGFPLSHSDLHALAAYLIGLK